MKLKVCGLKFAENIEEVVQLKPDYIGFIFYQKSPRFVTNLDSNTLNKIPKSIIKTGVFVNATIEAITEKVTVYGLDAIQLHGEESVELAEGLKQKNLTVIKVFRVLDELPEELHSFEGKVDYFLFDTKSKTYGGTGHQFDWSILEKYSLSTPYLLSGGISVLDIEKIKKFKLPGMIGIDVNSKFEKEPGLKNIDLLKELKNKL